MKEGYQPDHGELGPPPQGGSGLNITPNPESPEFPVMYILVNMDLKMGKGKIAAQVAHSACKVVEDIIRYDVATYMDMTIREPYLDTFQVWLKNSYAKVVLKSNEKQMLRLIEEHKRYIYFTRDAGRTQIPEGSLTTMAFYPMYKEEAPGEIKELKLL